MIVYRRHATRCLILSLALALPAAVAAQEARTEAPQVSAPASGAIPPPQTQEQGVGAPEEVPQHPFIRTGMTYNLVFGQGRMPELEATVLEIVSDDWVRAEAQGREVWLNVGNAVIVHVADPAELEPEADVEPEAEPRQNRKKKRRGGM